MSERLAIAQGLEIFEKTDPCMQGSVRAEHDVLIGATRSITLSDNDRVLLLGLGWFESAEYDGWIYRL